ncbi:MAG TPA: hypothetical protein VGO40_19970 [Longimicrobium sp.]|jgi:hypothetical protein|nr:hypothetical protein [Longimicrobium sp.]
MIDPADLLAAAKELSNSKKPLVNDEVCARTAANRAYYAAYLVTREEIRKQYGNPKYDVHHAPLSTGLSQNAATATLGSRLAALRLQRNDADYHPTDLTVNRLTVALRLKDAEYVIENASKVKMPLGL